MSTRKDRYAQAAVWIVLGVFLGALLSGAAAHYAGAGYAKNASKSVFAGRLSRSLGPAASPGFDPGTADLAWLPPERVEFCPSVEAWLLRIPPVFPPSIVRPDTATGRAPPPSA